MVLNEIVVHNTVESVFEDKRINAHLTILTGIKFAQNKSTQLMYALKIKNLYLRI